MPSWLKNGFKSLRMSLFATGFLVAAVGVVACAILAVSEQGAIGSLAPLFYTLLSISAVIIAGLAGAVSVRAARIFMGRRFGAPAPRLHMRFMALFALAAVAPSILMALLLALVLGRGVEFWFGERVTTLVETMAEVGRAQAPLELNLAELQLVSMAGDLSYPEAVAAMSESRIEYTQYLRNQAIGRNFASAYVIDSRSTILARAEAPGAPPFVAPSQRMYEFAASRDIGVSDPTQREDAPAYVRLLVNLPAYDDAYLYVVWYVDLGVLTAAEEATASYRQAVAREEGMRQVFILVYFAAVALILVGALWLALSAATRVVTPVARLVGAAERVRRGDLDARVLVQRDDDEIAALGRAFNRMTRQLRSQRRALLEANAESESRRNFIEAVLTGVSAGVVGLAPDNRITLVNRSAEALLDVEAGTLTGEQVDTVLGVFAPIVEEARRSRAVLIERQIDIPGNDGALLNLNVRASTDDKGELVITFDDVTRLVAAQRNAAWRDVARRIAHEIKNPLTPIQLSAERIRRKYRAAIPDDQAEIFDKCVETIVRQVSDIGRMVDEFSAFARMPTPKMEAADLVGVVEGAVFSQRVASPRIKLPLELPGHPVIVECDSRLTAQALANILKNAGESVLARLDEDGAKQGGEVAVTLKLENDTAVIEVVDNGLGWPFADRAKLTEPYMTTREKGTGLGLAIVRRVMEDHGGRLELEEREDGARGAVVRLAFPLLEITNAANESALSREA
ncbi:periplasmic sensor signal transduction histidine kinase [Glycocaulis alkaliphilus]|uniref:histidine kinase n=2 Tax=Glycocaulis alkaliphilus TaxID=1434191 RepID=A0A3T0E9U2_9PROT|nr:periplasmic sensor signal transduction histidine kinase [Glycocaulis alkaliphilus]GGB75220.1 PAS domain-containing sensor histidine kinase [Glycocaulis alkaliphilus]